MTTALAIITGALRESNLIAISATPTAPQQDEGLNKLNVLIASVLGFEVGEPLQDWPVGTEGTEEFSCNWNSGDWSEPPENARLMVTSTSAETISLHPSPTNGARVQLVDLTETMSTHGVTLDANGRRIEGADSITITTDGANITWFYRGDLGEWVRLLPLALADEMPFPIQFDTYFETMLAMRLNPRYGRAADEQTVAMLKRSQAQLKSTYRQSRSVRVDPGATTLSRTGQGMARSRPRRYGWMS